MKIDKAQLKKLEAEYGRKLFNGEIGKAMREILKARPRLLSPFKLGFLCSEILIPRRKP